MDAFNALVTSEARARVLTALYGEPGRTFYQQELARETGLPLLAVQRELRRLVPAGFVHQSVVGGRRLFEADRDSAVYAELQSIVLKLRGAGAAIRQVLADKKDVRLAWVFGSYATGTAGAASDIDVMVLGTRSPRQVRSEVGAVERSLGRTINEHVIAPREWSERLRRGEGFISEVRGGPKQWLVGNEAELRGLDPSR